MFETYKLHPHTLEVHFSNYGPVIFRIEDLTKQLAELSEQELAKVMNSMRMFPKAGVWQVRRDDSGIYFLYWNTLILEKGVAAGKPHPLLEDNDFLRTRIWREAMISFNRVFLCPDFIRSLSLVQVPPADVGYRFNDRRYAEESTGNLHHKTELYLLGFFGTPYSFCGTAFLSAENASELTEETWREQLRNFMFEFTQALTYKVKPADSTKDPRTAKRIKSLIKEIDVYSRSSRVLFRETFNEKLYQSLEKYFGFLDQLISLIWCNGEFGTRHEGNTVWELNRHTELLEILFQLSTTVRKFMIITSHLEMADTSEHSKYETQIPCLQVTISPPDPNPDIIDFLTPHKPKVETEIIRELLLLKDFIGVQLECGNVGYVDEVRFSFVFTSETGATQFCQQMHERIEPSENEWDNLGSVEAIREDQFCVRCKFTYSSSNKMGSRLFHPTHSQVVRGETDQSVLTVKKTWENPITLLTTHFALPFLTQLLANEQYLEFDIYKFPVEGYSQIRWDITESGYAAVIHIPGSTTTDKDEQFFRARDGRFFRDTADDGQIIIFSCIGTQLSEAVYKTVLPGPIFSSFGPESVYEFDEVPGARIYLRELEVNISMRTPRNWQLFEDSCGGNKFFSSFRSRSTADPETTDRVQALFNELSNSGGKLQYLNTEGYPFALDQGWPDARGKKEYAELHRYQTDDTLRDPWRRYRAEIPETNQCEIYVDIGAGTGKFVSQLRQRCPNAIIIAVGVTPLSPEYLESLAEGPGTTVVAYTPIPEDLQVLQKIEGLTDRGFDSFGALTYAKNPLHALIYIIRLLRAGGVFTCALSGNPHIPDGSTLGNALNRAAIKDFFQKYFAVDLQIHHSRVNSEVTVGTVWDDWHLFAKAPVNRNQMPGFTRPLAEIFALADQEIGIPVPVAAEDPAFKDFAITMREYVEPEQAEGRLLRHMGSLGVAEGDSSTSAGKRDAEEEIASFAPRKLHRRSTSVPFPDSPQAMELQRGEGFEPDGEDEQIQRRYRSNSR